VNTIYNINVNNEDTAVLFTAVSQLTKTTTILMDELAILSENAGYRAVERLIQIKDKPDAATYLGSGKILELKHLCENLDCKLAICDDELTPTQLKNLEKKLEVRVIDRTQVILDIFAQRASSAEGKIQVEAARLAYMLPRLRGKGVEMSRLGASSGSIRAKGHGETKLEYDKRRIKTRMAELRHRIDDIAKHRSLQREDRETRNVPTVALVGYTNAGKSSLLNALTEGGAHVEDKLFSTLDPTAREVTLSDNRKIMLIDTVGFVRKLPHHLVKAFRATLEEVKYADVLIHVVDISRDDVLEQVSTVENVLSELGVNEKPIVVALNKSDKVSAKPILPINGTVVPVSAIFKSNLTELLEAVKVHLPDRPIRLSFAIPYTRGDLLDYLHVKGKIYSLEYSENVTTVIVDVLPKYAGRVEAELRKTT